MTIPKLPFPAPRSAQSRSEWFFWSTLIALAPSAPDATTTSAADQVVAGHAEVAGEEAEAAAERRADQADGALRSGRHREVLLRRARSPPPSG